MYLDDNGDNVLQEGNTVQTINLGNLATPGNDTAWYNTVSVYVGQKRLRDLYEATPASPPLPDTKFIFSCPACAKPNNTYGNPFDNTPNANRAFFMYGMNGRLCINGNPRVNTWLSTIP